MSELSIFGADTKTPKEVAVLAPHARPGFLYQGQIRHVDKHAMFTDVHFSDLTGMTFFTNDLPDWFAPGNSVMVQCGMNGPTRITLNKTMPTYKFTNQNGTVTIETPDGRTLATIPSDQAKTFADVEAAIFDQNKGKGNAEECIEATNYFLIHGIKPKQ